MTTLKSFEPGQTVWVIAEGRVVDALYLKYINPLGQHQANGSCWVNTHDNKNIFASHSEALQELARRQLRAYAETLRELATVDPEAVHWKPMGAYKFYRNTTMPGDWGWGDYSTTSVLEAVDYAIQQTFGETQGETK